jgi:hypothetical protein
MVVIIDGNQVAQLKVTSERAGLAGHTLHQAAISEEAVCVVVDQVKAGLVEAGSSMCLGKGETDSIADTLTQRARRNLNTRSIMSFGVTRSDAVDLLESRTSSVRKLPDTETAVREAYAEVLEIIHGDCIAVEVEQGILQHATMTIAIRMKLWSANQLLISS